MSGVPERKSRKYQSRQWARVLFLAEPMFEVARKILSVASMLAMAVIYAVLAGSVIFILFYFRSIMLVILMMAIFEPLMTASFLTFVFLFFYGPGILMSKFTIINSIFVKTGNINLV